MIRTIPIGKKVVSAIYVHKNYADKVVPNDIFEQAKEISNASNFRWNVVKWDNRKETVSFIFCPDFDSQQEPEIKSVITVDLHKNTKKIRQYHNNCPIYHHKWLMVGKDYDRFLISRAMIRSLEIDKVIKKHRINKCRMGYKSYWDQVVIPLIKQNR